MCEIDQDNSTRGMLVQTLTIHGKLFQVNLLQIKLLLTILKKLNNLISAPGSWI